jgi:hypothetical protein
MDDPLGAFGPHGQIEIAGAARGPLAGVTFAVKDIFDVAGTVIGRGNPDWLASHGPAAGRPLADRGPRPGRDAGRPGRERDRRTATNGRPLMPPRENYITQAPEARDTNQPDGRRRCSDACSSPRRC